MRGSTLAGEWHPAARAPASGGDPVPPPLDTMASNDGSSYRGGVENGMQHGEGEWRSAQGDVYVGSFSQGVYEGHGRYADDVGNVYEGEFRAGVFDGLGTYIHADGCAECNRYEDGREIAITEQMIQQACQELEQQWVPARPRFSA